MNTKSSTPNLEDSPAVERVPDRLRTILVVLVLLHFSALIICLTSSYRLSGLAIEWLGYLSPYCVTTNMRMDLQPLAITNPSTLESPLVIEIGKKASKDWKKWPHDSRTGKSAGLSRIRQQRLLGQIAGLLEVRNEEGVTDVLAGMLDDIQSQYPKDSFDQFRIVMLPVVRAEEWEYAKRFENADELPEALQPEILMTANFVRFKDGSIGVLPQTEDYRTAPTIK